MRSSWKPSSCVSVFHSGIKFIFIVGFFYLGVCSGIQLDVFIIIVLSISVANVLLIDQLNPIYSSMRFDTVSAFGTSRIFFCFFMYRILSRL
jgi:hypothetical protein